MCFGFLELTRTKAKKKDLLLKKYIDYRLNTINVNKFIEFSRVELDEFIRKIKKGGVILWQHQILRLVH